MTDDRNDAPNGGGTDANAPTPQVSGPASPPPDMAASAAPSAPPPESPRAEPPGNPPAAASPPPLGDPSPPSLAAGPQAPPPARPTPWAAIIAVLLGVILIVLVILWFTGVLDRSPRNSSEEGTSMNGAASGTLGSLGGVDAVRRPAEAPPLETAPPAAPQQGDTAGYAPTATWLQGTWGPGCPESRAEAVTLYSGGRMVAPRGEGSWSLNGYDVTVTANGRSVTMRWEYISQDMARVTQAATGEVDTVRRCD